jgi:peptidyl-tRNA hydrolase
MHTHFFVTGFGAFGVGEGRVLDNPSSRLAEDTAFVRPGPESSHCVASSTILEVAGAAVDADLAGIVSAAQALLTAQPNVHVVFLHWGVAASNTTVDLEVLAANNASFRVPDERGWQPVGLQIEAGGPSVVGTTLPVPALVARMRASQPLAAASTDAGRFMCNYVYFRSCRSAAALSSAHPPAVSGGWARAHSIFVHVPPHTVLPRERLAAFSADLMRSISTLLGAQEPESARLESLHVAASMPNLWTTRNAAAAASKSAAAAPPPADAVMSALLSLGFDAADVVGAVAAVQPVQPGGEAAAIEAAAILVLAAQEARGGEPPSSSWGSALLASLLPAPRHKLAVIVRKDLKMTAGKIAAQVAHATLRAARTAAAGGKRGKEALAAWRAHGEPIIVLSIDDLPELERVEAAAAAAGLTVERVRDAGRTQVEPGTPTCVALGPATVALIDAVTGPEGTIPLRLLP